MPTTTITVTNLKGGTGKTTTAAYVAHALHELGARVLAVDADPQASLIKWAKAGGFPFATEPLVSDKLHRELPGIVGDRWQVVVIDTPPTEHSRAAARSAVLASTHVIVPVAPAPVEYERMRAVREMLNQAAEQGADFTPAVLLVRTITSAASTAVFRLQLTRDSWRVLRSSVPRREEYAQSFGMPIARAASTGYGDAIAELLNGEAT